LPVVNHTRDLGIIVSTDLSPSLHVTDIVSKAHIRAGLILRAIMSGDIHLLKRAFLSGHLVLLATSMPWNRFNVGLPSDC